MGRSYPLAAYYSVGDIVEVPMTKKQAGSVTVETKHHYRVDYNPAEGFFLSWVNPADRRQYGR